MSIIAKTVALSESTLKRYFKLIYGRSIYEYYLSRKNGDGQNADVAEALFGKRNCRNDRV